MKQLLPKIIGRTFNLLTPVFPKYTRNRAFDLLCRIKHIPVTETGRKFFDAGETIWMEISGTKTALHRWGKGPANVLFLHGWMSNSQRWKKYVESLDPELYSCYALDAPGHGDSYSNYMNIEIFRQAYEQSVKAIGEVDVVVGHSFGNLVAGYQYLYRPSVAVKSYVVLGSIAGLEPVFEYCREKMDLSPRMINNLGVRFNEVLKLPHSDITMKHFFRKLDKPVFLIHEETDTITPIAPIKEAASEAKNIEFHYTNGLDHTLKSDEILNLVLKSIETQSKTGRHVLERI